MRAARRTSVLVAFSLLTSAATAYAECGWVQWITALTPSGSAATPWNSFQSLPECKKVASSEAVKKIVTDAKPQGSVLAACLPDTLDPRGPKGAPR